MYGKCNRKFLTLTWGVTVLILFTFNLSGIIYYNGLHEYFDEVRDVQTTTQCDTMRCYEIEGAGYFLQAHSDFMDFLRAAELAELQGFDNEILAAKLKNSISSIQVAKDIYLRLKERTEVAAYRTDALNSLLTFDYEAYRESKRLNGSIFDEVKLFLRNGKVKEMLGKNLVHLDEIMAIAGIIQGELEAGRFPEVSHLHQLTESCTEALLFGQYAARVFQAQK